PELLPTAALNRCLSAAARRHASAADQCPFPQGERELRVQIARHAMEAGCSLSPDEIVVTGGCQEAVGLALRAVTNPGDTIAIESPAFYGILQLIESLGLKVCEVPTFPREGVCLEELEKRLDSCRIRACLFTLNFSNPLGSCMPDWKKAALVEMLARRNIPLIEDDVFGDITYDRERPKVAKAFDRQGLVLTCDSFGKTLAPGYRIGWIAPGRFFERVRELKFVTSAGTATLPQFAIADFLANGGYSHHLRRIRRAYANQMQQYQQAVARCFPPGTKVTRPQGGWVLWVELAPSVNAIELVEQALQEKITVAPGPIFSATQQFQNFIRLSCGATWSERVENALIRLGQIIERLSQ
ncbi:MAG TPA: PLP-dependent aminotransferase family protein, partial [Verrucomicrobiota bacterium]|nr:PLP-dependent aminotransferase family protein [Verrucomicrobiota bacterium]